MQQWRDAKTRHPDALIFMRVGDFYELFNEDAVEGAQLLGLTLTARNNGGASEVPLAGVPARARDEYLQRLVRLGRRVAVCEQVEDPALARGLVRREVVETITPGAILSDALLAERRNNYLVAVADGGAGTFAVAAVDISTGELSASRVPADALAAELGALEPAELVLPRAWAEREWPGAEAAVPTIRPDWAFDPDTAWEELERRFASIEAGSIGLDRAADPGMIAALGALTGYLAEVQPSAFDALRPPRVRRGTDPAVLDDMTRRNLELVEPLRPGGRDGRPATLIDVLDETLTPMGARLLRQWVLRPLTRAGEIWARQEAVGELHGDGGLRRRLRTALRDVRDLERLAAKIGTGRINPREMAALSASLAALPRVRDAVAGVGATLLAELGALDVVDEATILLGRAIAADPPATLADGGAIRPGYEPELDELRETRDGGQETLARMQARERERTGVPSLKVGYNKVFGYYIEVTRANLERVPPDYERRQTLANAERYVTPELKEWEAKILSAEERIVAVEARVFGEVRTAVMAHLRRIQDTAGKAACLDVLAALAHAAERRLFVRPEIHTGYRLEIRGGRHPVVEAIMPREQFIPNDTRLDEEGRVVILTGPNMAGKSTLLRQVGLIQLLGQIGSFVPAESASLPVCDRIFTRVGASDNLVRGQSTFMVEMQESAAILHGASRDSLVLLDEIGRGTATYDGVSIAWAVTEYLHEHAKAKTVFATHYHELTQLADLLPALVNLNVAVREVGQDIVFLHVVQPGPADRSYGIEVGRLAGLPPGVVARAREILIDLEGTHTGGGAGLGRAGRHRPRATPAPDQLSLFAAEAHPLLERLRALDVDRLTPLEALNALAELRRLVAGPRHPPPHGEDAS
ncbi:MAG: DNA mismatch repair protein MutS [Gemmatimonadota bacterium]